MKKISVMLFTAVFAFLTAFSACAAFKHEELYMTVYIPDSFQSIENNANSGSVKTYVDYDTARQINITNIFNFDDLDYSDLTDAEIKVIENSSEDLFINQDSGAYFTSDPSASVAWGNSAKGVKIHAQYINPSVSSQEVYADVYMFSTQTYLYGISFISFNADTSWTTECLDSLIVGKGLLEETTTETNTTEFSATSLTNAVVSDKTSDSSSASGPADVFEGIGVLCGIALICYLVYRVTSKKK